MEQNTPSFNFYSADFMLGVMFMEDHEAGKYVKLMCTQHQKGHLTLEQMEKVCDGPVPKDVLDKFIQDENGLYYNRRLEKEIKKKSEYIKSREKNFGNYYGKPPKKEKDEVPETPENASETPVDEASTQNAGDIPKHKPRKPIVLKPPSLEDVEKYFTAHDFPLSLAKRAWEGYQENNWIDTKGNEIKNWKLKMVQVWFKDELKIKNGIVEHGQHPGQNFVSGKISASFKK